MAIPPDSHRRVVNLLASEIFNDPDVRTAMGTQTPHMFYAQPRDQPPFPHLIHVLRPSQMSPETLIGIGQYIISIYTFESHPAKNEDIRAALISLLANQMFTDVEDNFHIQSYLAEGARYIDTENDKVFRQDVPFEVRYTALN